MNILVYRCGQKRHTGCSPPFQRPSGRSLCFFYNPILSKFPADFPMPQKADWGGMRLRGAVHVPHAPESECCHSVCSAAGRWKWLYISKASWEEKKKLWLEILGFKNIYFFYPIITASSSWTHSCVCPLLHSLVNEMEAIGSKLKFLYQQRRLNVSS